MDAFHFPSCKCEIINKTRRAKIINPDIGLGEGKYGDLNGNGIVDGPDYTEVLSYWGTGTPPGPCEGAIPEPATLGLLLAGGLAMLRRRH